jgi:hypothetical protein
MSLLAMLRAISSDKHRILRLKKPLTSSKKDLEKEIYLAKLRVRETNSNLNLLNTSMSQNQETSTSTKTQNLGSEKATSLCQTAAMILTIHLRWTSMKK